MPNDPLPALWPTFGLRLTTPRLALRVPREHELVRLAEVAGLGVHGPDEQPFLTPWTDGTALDRAREVLGGHWDRLAGWEPSDWRLGLGVFSPDGEPLGQVTLRARDFAVVREVATSSWLGVAHQGRGYGTEARIALLTLAFDHLGATDAVTEVFTDNRASQGVSRRLGYAPDGVSHDARGTEMLVSDRLRLTRERWDAARSDRPAVDVEGLEACRAMFGV